MHKLSHLVDGEWTEHSFAPLYSLPAEGQIERLVAGAPGGQAEPFERLGLCLRPPYLLLYVLHTPRGEAEAGRYQSPELSTVELRAFIARFAPFLAADARFDIWLYAPAEQATVVWDRHNQIFAYGPLDRFATALSALGFNAGSCEVVGPHQHHYRPEQDENAAALLSWCDWRHSPLRPEDEQ